MGRQGRDAGGRWEGKVGNEGTGLHGGEELMGVEGRWRLPGQSIGAGLIGYR